MLKVRFEYGKICTTIWLKPNKLKRNTNNQSSIRNVFLRFFFIIFLDGKSKERMKTLQLPSSHLMYFYRIVKRNEIQEEIAFYKYQNMKLLSWFSFILNVVLVRLRQVKWQKVSLPVVVNVTEWRTRRADLNSTVISTDFIFY